MDYATASAAFRQIIERDHRVLLAPLSRGLGENGRMAKDIYCYDPCTAPHPEKSAPMGRARKSQMLR